MWLLRAVIIFQKATKISLELTPFILDTIIFIITDFDFSTLTWTIDYFEILFSNFCLFQTMIMLSYTFFHDQRWGFMFDADKVHITYPMNIGFNINKIFFDDFCSSSRYANNLLLCLLRILLERTLLVRNTFPRLPALGEQNCFL